MIFSTKWWTWWYLSRTTSTIRPYWSTSRVACLNPSETSCSNLLKSPSNLDRAGCTSRWISMTVWYLTTWITERMWRQCSRPSGSQIYRDWTRQVSRDTSATFLFQKKCKWAISLRRSCRFCSKTHFKRRNRTSSTLRLTWAWTSLLRASPTQVFIPRSRVRTLLSKMKTISWSTTNSTCSISIKLSRESVKSMIAARLILRRSPIWLRARSRWVTQSTKKPLRETTRTARWRRLITWHKVLYSSKARCARCSSWISRY